LSYTSTFSSIRPGIKNGPRQDISFEADSIAQRQTARGRQLGFNEDAVQQLLTTRIDANEAPAIVSLIYGGDLGQLRRRMVPLIQPQFLLPEVLTAAGVPENYHNVAQTLARSVALSLALEEKEMEKYHLLDLERWIAMQPPEFFERHHLPSDPRLYHLNRLFELSQARQEILRTPLFGLLCADASKSQGLIVESHQLNIEAFEPA
jgi:hypothetical protein